MPHASLLRRAALGGPDNFEAGTKQMRAFIFPGQGSQSVGMGLALSQASPVARSVFQEVDEALGQHLFRIMTEGPDDQLLDRKSTRLNSSHG